MIADLFNVDDLKNELGQLYKARWSGALTVKYQANGVLRETTYRRDSELQAAIAALEAQLAELEGLGRLMNVVVRGNRGWLK